jgi:Ca2+-binding EF-hand superfamily protein
MDWTALFAHYDSQKTGLISKVELRRMMEDAGLTRVTDAEVRFVMNNIAAFKPTMTSSQLL